MGFYILLIFKHLYSRVIGGEERDVLIVSWNKKLVI